MNKVEINSLTLNEAKKFIKESGFSAFRGEQIFHWIHKRNVRSFSKMKNLPQKLIEALSDLCHISELKLLADQVSIDHTRKFLFELDDHKTIETVLIPEKERSTLCISSQVGCALNCSFCATGKSGFQRNLSAGEIINQVYLVDQIIETSPNKIRNIVFMGMGEPFMNYLNVIDTLNILSYPLGFNIGKRKMTVSTCGIVPKIYQFAQDEPQVGLAISLHAASNAKRTEIMPINKTHSLKELIKACNFYTMKTNRRITFEYALVAGFNDTKKDQEELVKLVKGLLCHVNIIPVNPVFEKYKKPNNEKINQFIRFLNDNKIPASLRKERGTDIDAACGQLRRKQIPEKQEEADEDS